MGGLASMAEDVTGINLSGDSRTDQAVRGQQDAARESNNLQRQMFDTQRADAQPWREAGGRALTAMENADFQKDFSMSDFQQDPGYAFRMEEAQKALERGAASRGGLNSGRFSKELMRQQQGMASEEYNSAYNRFNADRDRRFNRLSSLAGVGQTANSQIAQAGQNYANAYGQNVQGSANAGAAAAMGQAGQATALLQSSMEAMSGGGGKSALAFSDMRLKTNIRPIPKEEIAEMKKHLKAYAFNYKTAQHGSGDYYGVMAQDLEKSKLGQSLVFEDRDGFKQIDLARVLMLFLATMAEG